MILEVIWDGLWTLLLGSHNLMGTALGSCVTAGSVQVNATYASNNAQESEPNLRNLHSSASVVGLNVGICMPTITKPRAEIPADTHPYDHSQESTMWFHINAACLPLLFNFLLQ
jgi:hypothetical protein